MEEHEINLQGIKQFAGALMDTYGVAMSLYDVPKRRLTNLSSCDYDTEQLMRFSKLPGELNNVSNHVNPFQVSNEINCFWVAIPARVGTGVNIFVLGPAFIAPISRSQIIQYYYQQGIPVTQAQILADHYAHVPKLSYQILMSIFSMTYHMLYGKKPAKLGLEPLKNQDHVLEVNLNEEDICNIQERDFENERRAEKRLYEDVRNGDVGAVNNGVFSGVIDMTCLGPDELRSFKNMMIVAIALVTRAAVEGGLPVEVAFPLSDYYITQIEMRNNMASIIEMQQHAIADFTSRVKDNVFKLKYSKLVNRCCGYIVANVHRRVTVKELAEKERIHVDTLIRRFKKETGKTVVEYARHIKMKEACTLLVHTNKSVVEISSLLGYSSQSQFTYAFKEYAKTTPSQFRKKDRI